MRKLLSGNEAIALGAYHAGVRVAAAYPGTPSTEILEAIATFPNIYSEWSTNEKVAMEVAIGASYAGVRAMASMKHVGLNVAADPFFAVAVTGVKGGLVVVSADDPGLHSSQGEQDNRRYAPFARTPMLEPSDSQEAYDLTKLAYELSEQYDTPVLLRVTSRISHCKTIVEYEDIQPAPATPSFEHQPSKFVMVPANARVRHPLMEERIHQLEEYSETFAGNRIIDGDRQLGIVSSGVAFQYAREVFPEATFLKLALTYPLPVGLIRRFASMVDEIVVVEELDPILEDALKALGLKVRGKDIFPIVGELSTEVVAGAARQAGLLSVLVEAGGDGGQPVQPSLPPRPPRLCPGCPHVGFFYALRRLPFDQPHRTTKHGKRQWPLRPNSTNVVASGDIGCYTLGVYPPLQSIDSTTCMGGSIGHALGMEKSGLADKVVAIIGDSTFMHSGITPLIDVVYNQGKTTVVILDNGTTAMTGHQGHPGTGLSSRKQQVTQVSLERLVRGVGIDDVAVVDAFNLEAVLAELQRMVESQAPSVLIVRGPCVLTVRMERHALRVDPEVCTGCRACLQLGCPALSLEGKKVVIDPTLCAGESCQLCYQVCPENAIRLPEEASVGA
jgi:indolepyruvate ferredoxin oxidoreductase alpha subunit